MFQLRAFTARNATCALAFLLPLSGCDMIGLSGPSAPAESAEPELAGPSVFETVLDFTVYGTAEVEAHGNTLALTLPGGGEGGVALTLKPAVTTMIVAGFSLDAPAPMNLRLTRADGTTEYLSTESRGSVVLGPEGDVEALIYSPDKSKAKLVLTSTQPCGGNIICDANGRMSIRIGEAGPLAFIAASYGASSISEPEPGSITAAGGAPSGEYGFTLVPETPNTEPLLLEFRAKAPEPVNLVVQTGEAKTYVSSDEGWVRVDPGSTILAYTPGMRTFSLAEIKAAVCTPEEPRCQPEPQLD